ncbi:phosphonopyruvate decarboxylase [Desulfobotulus alkaliphilus]|uniref:Phosphonopyruvate decarboxylase n=1 Tax=Desulfobotulus alkaliphilus TaxID=622671 RepID=A0A562RAY3_9BACT|nr:phosphonopyruvate decarboxylase [Desulfobotulus alkaliphilus]TWI66073.1 phosphonopyruvate decarboxylase [Desulfobotulus alkaliphilus]
MIEPSFFYELIRQKGTDFFAGVPDSLLKHFCAFVDDRCSPKEHIITANEGNAIAMAAGYHMATGKTGAVYMQNSGLGNCVNPLTSLTDPEVYGIPMLLVIGWRGEPGVKDEPQHIKQGRITRQQLDILEIPHAILGPDTDPAPLLDGLFAHMEKQKSPAAVLVKKNTFAPYKAKAVPAPDTRLMREEALSILLGLADASDLIVSTTGKTSRELFEVRQLRGEKQRDFLTVGSMGHTASIAMGVAAGRPEKRVLCLDGDGSLLMHMGSMAIIGSLKPDNFVHILLNNAAHESVGGQPTVAGKIDFKAMARACGYRNWLLASDAESLKGAWEEICRSKGPQMLEIKILPGSRDNLGRPTSTPEQNRQAFMAACCDIPQPRY